MATFPRNTLVSGQPQPWLEGSGALVVNGNLASETITFAASDDDGANWVTLYSITTLGVYPFALPAGAQIKATYTGSPTVTMKTYAEADCWTNPTTASSSGGGGSGTSAIDQTTPGTTNRVAEGTVLALVSANFIRPANTTQYADGDAVANNVTAGSVTPMDLTVGRASSGLGLTGRILKAKLKKTGTSLTTAEFRLHLYSTSPTPATGDNAASFTTDNAANYLGYINFLFDPTGPTFSDGAVATAIPPQGREICFFTQHIYGLLEAKDAYTPISAEVFTVELDVQRN